MNMVHNNPREGVYASYAVTPASAKLLEEFSGCIVKILETYNFPNKPNVEFPSDYHLTAEYRGTVNDIHAYIDSVNMKKKVWESTVNLWGLKVMTSNADESEVIYLQPAKEIPYILASDKIPHVTVAKISGDPLFNIRLKIWNGKAALETVSKRLSTYSKWKGNLQIDTSKLQIRGKKDGEKQLIEEI